MASIRDDELPSSTGIPSAARRADWSAPPTLPVTEELLLALPKTDLHCHLDGSMRLKMLGAMSSLGVCSMFVTRKRTASRCLAGGTGL